MIVATAFLLGLLVHTEAVAVDGQNGCLFNGLVYAPGQSFTIEPCLALMTCKGNNRYDSKPLEGQCKNKRNADGQTGCDFDGKIYAAGEKFIIPGCLAEMTCMGFNNYDSKPLGGVCPDKRQVDSQSVCVFNMKVYAAGESFIIPHCLAQMTCLGHNNYQTKPLGGQC